MGEKSGNSQGILIYILGMNPVYPNRLSIMFYCTMLHCYCCFLFRSKLAINLALNIIIVGRWKELQCQF